MFVSGKIRLWNNLTKTNRIRSIEFRLLLISQIKENDRDKVNKQKSQLSCFNRSLIVGFDEKFTEKTTFITWRFVEFWNKFDEECLKCLSFEYRSSDFSSSSKFWKFKLEKIFSFDVWFENLLSKKRRKDFLLFHSSTKRKVNSTFYLRFVDFSGAENLKDPLNCFSSISVSWNEKLFPLFFFSDKSIPKKKKCFVLFLLEKKRWSFQSILLWEIWEFSSSIVDETRCVERSMFCLNKVEHIFGIKREKLSLWDFPLSINSAPISIKYRRISLYSSWRHKRGTKHRLVSCLVFHLTTTIVFSQRESVEETNIFSFVDLLLSIERTKMKSVNERRDFHLGFWSLNKSVSEQSCREESTLWEKITSMRRSLNWWKIFSLHHRKQNSLLLDENAAEIVRCSTWIKSSESQSVVWLYSLNKMLNLPFEKSWKIFKKIIDRSTKLLLC